MADLRNIALSVEATQAASELKSLGIVDQMSLIKIGFAYAVSHEVDLDRDSTSWGTRGGSNYDSGGLDGDGLMARTVEIFYDLNDVNDEPYRVVETLMSKGLLLLHRDVKTGVVGSLSDLVEHGRPGT